MTNIFHFKWKMFKHYFYYIRFVKCQLFAFTYYFPNRGADSIKNHIAVLKISGLFKFIYYISGQWSLFHKKYWSKDFIWPLANNKITDPYGYVRQTGVYNIAHKGIDLSAKEYTKVFAINTCVVKLVKKFTVYGWTVIIDHGFGVDSIYMHLNKPLVKQGQMVKIGQNIAISGATGYAEFAHLHFSLRISGVSVDPEKFLNLFK